MVVSRARWDEYQRMLVTQEEESRRRAQEVDCGDNQSWAAVYQSIARRMLSYLDNSEALKASAKELKEQVLSPNEPCVDMERIVRQTRSEKDPSRRWEGALANAYSSGAGMPGPWRNN